MREVLLLQPVHRFIRVFECGRFHFHDMFCFTDAVIVGTAHAKNTVNNASGIFGMAGRKTFRQHSNSI